MQFNYDPRFNPYFINQNRTYPRSIIYPRFNTRIKKTSVLNLSKIIDTTQRGINTINQIVPIYKQVTPIFKQVASFSKSINSFLFRKPNNIRNDQVEEVIKSKQASYRNEESPNSPFFK